MINGPNNFDLVNRFNDNFKNYERILINKISFIKTGVLSLWLISMKDATNSFLSHHILDPQPSTSIFVSKHEKVAKRKEEPRVPNLRSGSEN